MFKALLMFPLLLTTAFGYTLHSRDVFQPPKPPAPEIWSAETQEQRQTLEFESKENTKIRGWLYKSDRSEAPYVLYFYGSNEDLAHEAKRLAWLRDTFHVNAVCFDYPGYGFSGGSVDADAIRSAALQENDFLQEHFTSQTPIIVYGWSIGTGLAIHVAAERKTAGLILQAPPASADEMTAWSSHHDVPWYAHGVVKIKADPAVAQLYEGARAIRTVSTPLLVIHGELDDVVPIEQGREVFNASPATRKEFVAVPGAHHNDLRVSQEPASLGIGHFLDSLSH